MSIFSTEFDPNIYNFSYPNLNLEENMLLIFVISINIGYPINRDQDKIENQASSHNLQKKETLRFFIPRTEIRKRKSKKPKTNKNYFYLTFRLQWISYIIFSL